MLIEFLKQITLNNVLASTVKRFGLYAAEYALLNMVVPGWMSTPFRYTLMTVAGSGSKSLFWWAITPKKNEPYADQPLVFMGPEEEISDLRFVVVNETQGEYQLQYKSIKTRLKDATRTVVNGVGNYVVNVTMGDLVEGTGAAIGTGVASGAFILFMGPPSLLTLPAFYLADGTIRSFGAFAGRKAGKHVLGDRVAKPLLKAYFSAESVRGGEVETDIEMDDLSKSLAELSLQTVDDIVDSFILIESEPTPEPVVHLYSKNPIKIIDDYVGSEKSQSEECQAEETVATQLKHSKHSLC